MSDVSGCPCVCHAGAGGLWTLHICEHCAPGWVARRSAREQEDFVRRDTAQSTPQTTPNTASGHSAGQGALA
jgi:hypothetical protein